MSDSQLRVAGMGSVIGLDWNPVIKLAEAMRIKTDMKFFRMLRSFESAMTEEMGKKK